MGNAESYQGEWEELQKQMWKADKALKKLLASLDQSLETTDVLKEWLNTGDYKDTEKSDDFKSWKVMQKEFTQFLKDIQNARSVEGQSTVSEILNLFKCLMTIGEKHLPKCFVQKTDLDFVFEIESFEIMQPGRKAESPEGGTEIESRCFDSDISRLQHKIETMTKVESVLRERLNNLIKMIENNNRKASKENQVMLNHLYERKKTSDENETLILKNNNLQARIKELEKKEKDTREANRPQKDSRPSQQHIRDNDNLFLDFPGSNPDSLKEFRDTFEKSNDTKCLLEDIKRQVNNLTDQNENLARKVQDTESTLSAKFEEETHAVIEKTNAIYEKLVSQTERLDFKMAIFKQIQEERDKLEALSLKKEEEIKDLNCKMSALSSNLIEKKQELVTLDKEKRKKEQEIDELRKKLLEIQNESEILRDEKIRIDKEAKQTNDENSCLKNKLHSLETEHGKDLDKLKEIIDKTTGLQALNDELKKQIERIAEEKKHLLDNNQDIIKQSKILEEQLKELERVNSHKIAQRESEKKSLQNQIMQLQREKDKDIMLGTQQLESVKKDLEMKFKHKEDAMTKDLRQVNEEKAQLAEKLQTKEENETILKQDCQKHVAACKQLQQQLNDKQTETELLLQKYEELQKLKQDESESNKKFKTENNELQTKLKELREQNRKEKEKASNRIKELMEQDVDNKKTIEVAVSKIECHKLTIQKLNTRLKELETDVHARVQENNQLKDKIRKELERGNLFQTNNIKLEKAVDDLKSEMERQEYQLKEENKQLIAEIQTKKKSLTDMKSEQCRMENHITELQRHLKSKESILQQMMAQKKLRIQLYSSSRGDMLITVETELTKKLKSQMETDVLQLEFIQCARQEEIEPEVPVLLLCTTASRLGADVTNVLQGLTPTKKMVLLIFHHKDVHALPTQASERVLSISALSELGAIVDMAFLTGKGIYSCPMNNNGFVSIIHFIKQEGSEESLHSI